ncbi:MAG: DUF5666 domain-containing protein [Anaerolineales bacterium]
MDQKKFEDFEKALTDLSSGQDFRKIVETYPELGEEIETAKLARSFSTTMVPSDILQRSRTKLLLHTKELRQEVPTRNGFFQRVPRIAYVLVLVIFFLLSWNGLIIASAQALPGDHLYPAKITLEKLHIGLALNPQTHQKAEEEYQSRRVDEVKRLLAIGRMEFVQFLGIVEQQWNDRWIVDGIEVRLLPETIVLGDIQDGMMVEVEGSTLPEGWVQASEIHLQNFSFNGTVELISESNWTISGRDVQITSSTLIDADIKVGDNVLIDVISDDFGNLTARSITRNDQNIQITKTPILPGDFQEKSIDTPKTEDASEDDQAGNDDSNEESKTPERDEIEDVEENRESDENDESKDADESDETNESDENDESKDKDDSDNEDESHDRDERDKDVEPDEKD